MQSDTSGIRVRTRAPAAGGAASAPIYALSRHKHNKKPRTATRYSALTSFLFTRAACAARFVSWQTGKEYTTLAQHTVANTRVNRSIDRFLLFFSRIVFCLPQRRGALIYTGWRNAAWHWSLRISFSRTIIPDRAILRSLVVYRWRPK